MCTMTRSPPRNAYAPLAVFVCLLFIDMCTLAFCEMNMVCVAWHQPKLAAYLLASLQVPSNRQKTIVVCRRDHVTRFPLCAPAPRARPLPSRFSPHDYLGVHSIKFNSPAFALQARHMCRWRAYFSLSFLVHAQAARMGVSSFLYLLSFRTCRSLSAPIYHVVSSLAFVKTSPTIFLTNRTRRVPVKHLNFASTMLEVFFALCIRTYGVFFFFFSKCVRFT